MYVHEIYLAIKMRNENYWNDLIASTLLMFHFALEESNKSTADFF